MSLLIAACIYIVFCVVLIYVVFGGFLYGAMYMKLPAKHVQRMLKHAELNKDKLMFDLGAGYGNIAFQAAPSGADIIAVEADPFKAWWIQHKISQKKLTNVLSVKADLRKIDLSKADVILSYTSDGLMNAVAEKNLKCGCVTVSCCHKICGWTPTLIDPNYTYPIYIYHVT
jgi:hypothetical protein